MIPQESIPIVSPVTIHWNDRQIPFIEANSDEDLAVALGLVHAHLRLAQLEVMRRVALGRVAEMIGPLGIEIDRSLRLMSFGRAVPKIIATLSEPTRIWAEGFIRGINHHLVHTAKQPHEFKVLGITPEPWTLTDLFTLARLHAADITWLVWSRLLRVRARMDPKEWATLWPRLLASDTPSTFAATADTGVERAFAAATRSGSNSAAVSAARSASNASMIASDPHLPLGLPNPWLIAGVHSPGYHVVGLMVPGLPFIALGRNRWIAWGGTNLHAQASDLFDISELPAHVMVERGETIRVRWSRRRRLRLRE
ncbi:MAG: penicillin acylase family protein, partial [Methylocella sp.]